MRPTGPRDLYAGSEHGPEPPFPIKLRGPVIKGFGRGSRELGIPTANIPPSGLAAYPDLQSGVYFGFVGLRLDAATTQPADNSKLTLSASATTSSDPTPTPTPSADTTPSASTPNTTSNPAHSAPTTPTTNIYPSVLSIGYNPFYANSTRSIEIHILHHFRQYNFYHAPLNLLVMGFIRPEYDYESLEALVSDIRVDCEVAGRSLRRAGYVGLVEEGKGTWGQWLRDFEWVENIDVEEQERGVLGGDGGKGEGKAEGEKEKL